MPRSTRHPIKRAAVTYSGIAGGLGAVITVLATVGLLTTDQASAVTAGMTALTAAVAGVITAASSVWAAFGAANKAEPDTTPVDDPRDRQGMPLVRADATP